MIPLDSPARKKHVALDTTGTYHPAIPTALPCGTTRFVIYPASHPKVKSGTPCATCYRTD